MTSLNLVDNSFKYNLLVMKIWGLYPYDKYPHIYKFYAFLLYFLLTIPAPLLPAIKLYIVRERDMVKITNILLYIFEVGICILKFLPFKKNPEIIKKCIFALNQDIFNRVSADQMHFIRETETVCRNIFFMYMSTLTMTILFWPTKVLFYAERTFPIDIWLPFDPFGNVAVYLGAFTYLFIATANAPIGRAAIDPLIAGLMYHAACQMKILKHTLQHLSSAMDESAEVVKDSPLINDEQLKNEIIYRKICDCIEHYDAIYEFVGNIEDTFSFVILSQFAVSTLVICMSCFQVSNAEPLTAAFYLFGTCSILLEVFFYCYFGNVLYEENDTLNFAIYSSDWYNFDEKSKKALIILMERGKRPMLLTIGKLVDLSLETWTTIIRRSYSLMAVVNNYQ